MQEIKCPNCGEVFQVDESSYDSIVKQVRDKEFTKEIEERANYYAREKEAAVKLAQTIDDEEILEVHKIYINSASDYMNAVSLTLAAIETQDYAQVSVANEKLNDANNLALDFKKELNKLAEKYNVVIEKE